MSKESVQRQKLAGQGVQGDLFACLSKGSHRPGSRTAKGEARALLSSRLERQRALTIGIMDKISSYESLTKAIKAVRRNCGAAGTDRVTIEEYERDIAQRIKSLHERLLSGSYEPQEEIYSFGAYGARGAAKGCCSKYFRAKAKTAAQGTCPGSR